MFRFESLEVLYWDCWERFKIPLDERVITISGPNGSGKTTLLDALRTLLATKTSQKRDYKKYARRPNKQYSWLVATVANKRDSQSRPPFYPIMTKKVTLACQISKKGGDWQRSYYIIPGTPELEEIINQTANSQDPYFKPRGVRDYQVELEKAGLSDAMLTVLSLEQGATDKLCEYKPKDLLKLVYTAFGDKPTIENYEKAIFDQLEAEKELDEHRVKSERLYNQCSALTNRVNNYQEFERLTSQQSKLETETKAQATFVALQEGVGDLTTRIYRLREELTTLSGKEGKLAASETELGKREKALRMEEERSEKEIGTLQNQINENNKEIAGVDQRTEEIRRLKDACKGIAKEAQEPLEEALEGARREKFSTEEILRHSKERTLELEKESLMLKSNRLSPDRRIEEFTQVLTDKGIDHSFLYENVEIKKEKWRVAIESILKGYRYVAILEKPSDRWKAWKLGEKHGFPHFIVGEEEKKKQQKAPDCSALSVVTLSTNTPLWIGDMLAGIQLVAEVQEGKELPEGSTFVTAMGYMRERRGGRSIAVASGDFAFGERGRKKRLKSVEEQIKEIITEGKAHKDALVQIGIRIGEIENRIENQKILLKYEEQKEVEKSLVVEKKELKNVFNELRKSFEECHKKRKAIGEERLKLTQELGTVKNEFNHVRESLGGDRLIFSQRRKERIELYGELRTQRRQMPGSWRTEENLTACKKEYGSVKDVERTILFVTEKLDNGKWEKDSAVQGQLKKMEKDFNAEKEELVRKETEVSETIRVTREGREAYIDYLRASIRFYEKNLKGLAKIAGVEIEVLKPSLENDDSVLREAGLEVKWNFDQKGFTRTDDGEGSGGQQVIKSLILLISLLMSEGDCGGFVFVDEPFAHLDIFNIDKVTEFLLATETQYIITSPNTHNTNIYRPSFLTLVTKKKGPNEPFAGPPAFIRRMDSGDA